MYKYLIRPLLYRFDAEAIHVFVTRNLHKALRHRLIKKIIERLYRLRNPALERTVFGIRFANPVGLAAGFDKGAFGIEDMQSLGFGFTEVGTVTPLPQPGNAQPRIFRLPKDTALLNRMGFNSWGAKAMAERLGRRARTDMVVGINIGKNKETPLESAHEDYVACFKQLHAYGDYFVINVSSPNTPGLRSLQDTAPLRTIIEALQAVDVQQHNPKPLLLKIAPDMTNEQLDSIIALALETKLAGVVAINTTVSRENLNTDKNYVASLGEGGVSGKPLSARSTEVIRHIAEATHHTLPIIASGGVCTVQDALEKLEAGASLVELYTGFIYEGPGLIKKINKAIIKSVI